MKKLIPFLMSIVFLFSLAACNDDVIDINLNDGGENDGNELSGGDVRQNSSNDYGYVEKKGKAEAEFTYDVVVVTLTHRESMKLKEYTPQDFSEIDCVNVYEVTIYSLEAVKEGVYPAVDSWCRIFSIVLAEPSRESVLHAVEILSIKEGVRFAEPNYIYHQD
jgi:hypothetical protein